MKYYLSTYSADRLNSPPNVCFSINSRKSGVIRGMLADRVGRWRISIGIVGSFSVTGVGGAGVSDLGAGKGFVWNLSAIKNFPVNVAVP